MAGQQIFVDGSSSQVFGSAYCIVIKKVQPKKIVKVIDEQYHPKYVEYVAILNAVRLCEEGALIHSDCLNVVNEIKYKKRSFNPQNNDMLQEIKKLIKEKGCRIRWVRRSNNPAGRKLEDRLFKLKYSLNSKYPNNFT